MNFTPTTLLPSTPSHQLRLEVPTPLPSFFFIFLVFPRNIQLTPGPPSDLFPPTSASSSFYSLGAAKIGEEQSASTSHHLCARKQKRFGENLVTKLLVGWYKIRV